MSKYISFRNVQKTVIEKGLIKGFSQRACMNLFEIDLLIGRVDPNFFTLDYRVDTSMGNVFNNKEYEEDLKVLEEFFTTKDTE